MNFLVEWCKGISLIGLLVIGMLIISTHETFASTIGSISLNTRSYIIAGPLPEYVTANTVSILPTPQTLYYDQVDGLLYFVEKKRIRKINLSTKVVSTVVGNGQNWLPKLTNDPLTSEIKWPYTIQRWKDRLIWTDSLYRILQLDLKTNLVTQIFGTGNQGNTLESSNVTNPLKVETGILYSIAVNDATGDVYFGDYNNHCIRKLDGNTGLAGVYAGVCGDQNITSNVPLTEARFGGIEHMIYCGDSLYIDNFPRVQKVFNNSGEMWIKTVLENVRINGFGCYNGDLYAYTWGSQIIKITPTLTFIIGTGHVGETPDGKISSSSPLGVITGLSIDKSSGDIYFVEKNYIFRKINGLNLSTLFQYQNLKASNPKKVALEIHASSLAYDNSGLFIAEGTSIKFLNFSTFTLEEYAGMYYDCGSSFCFSIYEGCMHSSSNGIYLAKDTKQISFIVSDIGIQNFCKSGDQAKTCQLTKISSMQLYNDELYFITDLTKTNPINFGKVTKNGTIEFVAALGASYFFLNPIDNGVYYMEIGCNLNFYDFSTKKITFLYQDKLGYYCTVRHVTTDGRLYYSIWDSGNNIIKEYKLNSNTSSVFITGDSLGTNEDGGLASSIKVTDLISLHHAPNLDSLIVVQYNQVRRVSSNVNKCFSISGLDNTVCSGNGACVQNDVCECFSGFYGERCNVSSCFGIRQDNPIVCNGKGQCSSEGKCTCQSGFGGLKCESKTCYGIPASNPGVCSGRGSCVDINTCQCFADSRVKITGDACENLLCKGVYNGIEDYFSTVDSRVCSKHGKCSFNATGSMGCMCESGYYGDSCEQFKCFSIPRNSSNACSGHGKCSDIDTCQCVDDETNGHYYYPNCNACHPAFGGTSCKEKACTGSTCLNGGTCGSDNQCICSGNFNGSICGNCKADYFGGSCNTYCNEKGSCNGNGNCNPNGQCVCFNDKDHGYWTGPGCNSCTIGYYGSNCLTFFSSFNASMTSLVYSSVIYGQVSKMFDGITFKLFGPSSYIYNNVPCSSLLHATDLSLFGSEPKCYWSDRSIGDFKIEFDNDFIFDFSLTSSISLNTNIFYKSITNFISLTLLLSNNIQLPNADIKTSKKLFSTSENIYFSGANSFSGDKKGLEYYWDLTGNAPLSVVQSIRSNTGPTVKIDKNQLFSGIYTIQLAVKSQVSKLISTTESLNFQVQDVELPSVTISGNKEVTLKSTEKSLTFKKITNIPESLKNQEMMIEWKFIEGPLIDFKKDTYNNLYIEQFISGKWKYSFKVVIYAVENPSLTANDIIVINTEQPALLLSLFLQQSTSLTQTIQVNYQDPENNLDEKEIWRWDCIDSETNGYCGDLIVNQISQYAKTYATLISIDKKDFTSDLIKSPKFTLTVIKGQRTVSSSITLKIYHPPPIVNVIDVSPKVTTINNDVAESQTLQVEGDNQTVSSSIASPFTNIKVVNKNQQSSIIIDSKELEEGMKHSIQLRVSFMNKNDEIVATEIFNNFTKSIQPKKCPCKISPSTGVSMKTDFTFTCENCQNEENTIEIKQGYIDKETGIKVPIPLSSDSSIKIPSLSTITSKRELQQQSDVTLFIELKDSKTGESRMMQSNVTVKPDSVSSLNEIMDHVANQTGMISLSMKDGDTMQSVSQTINTVVSTSQLLLTLPSSAKNATIVSSIQSNLLDTLSNSLDTVTKDTVSESSAMAILAVHSMVKSGDVLDKPVISKSITILSHVVQLTIKSKVDLFQLSSKPFMSSVDHLSNQLSNLKELKEKYSSYESIVSLVESFVHSYVQVQPVSGDPAALQEDVVNVKSDKVYLTDYSSSLITSPPVKSRGLLYQSYVKIPTLFVTESSEYSELVYTMVLKEHVPTLYQQVLDSSNTSLKVVSPVSVSFYISSLQVQTIDLSHNISINININEQYFSSSSQLSAFSCLSVSSDLKADATLCKVSGRDVSTNSITCYCTFTNWKVTNLIIVKDLTVHSIDTHPEQSINFSNDVYIIVGVVVGIVVLILIVSAIIIVIGLFCFFKKSKLKQIKPQPGNHELLSQDIEQPTKSESSVISVHM